jgi:hypothetical protein
MAWRDRRIAIEGNTYRFPVYGKALPKGVVGRCRFRSFSNKTAPFSLATRASFPTSGEAKKVIAPPATPSAHHRRPAQGQP